MVSGAPDFWLKGKYIELVDAIRLIDHIHTINTIHKIDEITNLDTLGTVNTIKNIDMIKSILTIKKISSFGETGTLTYFSEVGTADIVTPTAGYRTRVLAACLYNETDIKAYLRWKNGLQFVLGVPTVGLVGMNPFNLRHPLGIMNEVLELYMSGVGVVKGWVITDEVYGTGTAHTKTITELLGLTDSYSTEYVEGGAGEWVSPTGHEDPDDEWGREVDAYDDDLRYWANFAYTEIPRDTWGKFLELTHAAITCSKVRLWQYYYSDDCKPSIVDIDVFNGEWHHVYEGEISLWKDWVEYAFTAIPNVTKMRVRYYVPHVYCAEGKPWLVEADFFSVA